jgi:hypothetical protein
VATKTAVMALHPKIGVGDILHKPDTPLPARPSEEAEAIGRRAADRLRPYIGDMACMRLVDNWRCWDRAYLDDRLETAIGPWMALDTLLQPSSPLRDLAEQGLLGDVAEAQAGIDALRTLRLHASAPAARLPASWSHTARQWRLARL